MRFVTLITSNTEIVQTSIVKGFLNEFTVIEKGTRLQDVVAPESQKNNPMTKQLSNEQKFNNEEEKA